MPIVKAFIMALPLTVLAYLTVEMFTFGDLFRTSY